MNKLTKLLSVFAIAGAIGTGIAGAAGCAHKHTYEEKWTSAGADGHYHVATCHPEEHDELKPHVYDDDNDKTCNDCGYERTITPTPTPDPDPDPKPEEKYKVPASTVALIVEGVGDAEVQLSAEKKSHTIVKDNIKVYLGTGDRSHPTKGDEVPAKNISLTLRDPAEEVCASWEGLKLNGKYTITAKFKDVTDANGGAIDVDSYTGTAQVDVKNAVKAGSLAVKSGATLSQGQSVEETMSSTWTYEITRANDDKEDVAVKDVTVGRIDHVHKGADKEVEVSATIDGAKVTGKVTYTITEVTGAVVQSKAAHANKATLGSITEDTTIAAGITIKATTTSKENCTIDANAKSIDGKVFANRLKLEGAAFVDGTQGVKGAAAGTEFAATALKGGRRVEFAGLNATTTQGATAKSLITAYGCSSSSSEARNLTLYKKVGTGEEAKVVVVATQEAPGAIAKLSYVVEEAGDYFLGSESGGINLYYIQVDTILVGETGAEDVNLGGSLAPQSITLDTEGVKKVYKKTDTELDTTGVKVTLTKANDVTADKEEEVITTGISYSTPDFTKLGSQDITVTYTYDTDKTLTAKYSITVESEVAGVWGAEAQLKSTVNTVLANAGDTLTLTLGDLEGSLKGENANATVTVVSAKYGENVAITAEGVQLSKGKYTITATVKVSDGTNEATFENIAFDIRVSVEGEAEPVFVKADDLEDGKSLKDATNKITSDKFEIYSGGSGDTKTATVALTATAQDGSGETFTKAWVPGGKGRTYTITAKADTTLTIYYTVSNGDIATTTTAFTKSGDLQYQIGSGAAQTDSANAGAKSSNKAYAVTIEVHTGDVVTLSLPSDNSNRLVLFAVASV